MLRMSRKRGETAFDSSAQTISLWRLVHEDYVSHGRQSSLPGFRALLVYRFGAWGLRQRTHRPLVAKAVHYVWVLLFRFIRNRYGIELPETAEVGRRVRAGALRRDFHLR